MTCPRYHLDNCVIKTGIMTPCFGFIKVPAGNFNFFLSQSFRQFLPLQPNAFYVLFLVPFFQLSTQSF